MHTDMLQCKLESLYEDITIDAETGDVVMLSSIPPISNNPSNIDIWPMVSVQFA